MGGTMKDNKNNQLSKNIESKVDKKKNIPEEKGSIFLTILIITILSALGVLFYLKYHKNQLAHYKIINNNLVTEGSGLYADTYETGLNTKKPFTSKYYFRGKNVNNYLVLANKCFRIVNIAQNNALKIMYVGKTNNSICENMDTEQLVIKWDEKGKNIWSESSIKTYLEDWAKELGLDESPYIIQDATWYVGGLKFFEGESLTSDIKNERNSDLNDETIYNGMIGLINASDYLKANEKICFAGAFKDLGQCGENNYLNNERNFWTMNKTYNDNERVWAVERALISVEKEEVEKNLIQSKYSNNDNFEVHPVVYLKANLVLKGYGTATKPYFIAQ